LTIIIQQGWATSFAGGPSSKVSQNEGPHDCTHNKFYYDEVICRQTYAVLIRLTMAVFTYLKHEKGH